MIKTAMFTQERRFIKWKQKFIEVLIASAQDVRQSFSGLPVELRGVLCVMGN